MKAARAAIRSLACSAVLLGGGIALAADARADGDNFNLSCAVLATRGISTEADSVTLAADGALDVLKTKLGAVVVNDKTIVSWEGRTEKFRGAANVRVGDMAMTVRYGIEVTPRFLEGGDVELNIKATLWRLIDGQEMPTRRTIRSLAIAPHGESLLYLWSGVLVLFTPTWR